jgi:Carboxypeptidase regulatory-like domain
LEEVMTMRQLRDRFRNSPPVGVPILLLLALLAATFALRAQDLTTSAVLTGTVTDSTGAVIPQATITVTGVDNGISRTTKTDGSGGFTVPLLPAPASYNLRVQAKGFKSFEQEGVSLITDRTTRQDVQLGIGTETEQVTVTSQGTLLNTGDANLSAEIGAKQVEDLPLNLRNVISLATLNSSVTNTTESQQLNEGGTSGKADQDVSFLNFGGGFFGTSAYLLDGIWDTDSTWGAVIYVPSVEAVQSFKIQTNSFTAQTGFSTGNVVNIETKSGTSNFHGDAFEFIRNSKLDANSYFNNYNHSPKLAFHRDQFGASAGGPVYIPGLYRQRDKTFIFGVYEGLRQTSPVNSTFTVPTTLMRTGNFSEVLGPQVGTDALGLPVLTNEIYNPFSGRVLNNGSVDASTGRTVVCPSGAATCWYRDPFPGNIIPQTAQNAIGVKLFSYYPTPTSGGTSSNFFGSAAAPTKSDEYLIRGDENLTNATRLYVRFASKHEQKTNSPTYYGANDPGGPGNIRPNNRYSIVAGISHVFTPTLAASANAGFHRWNQGGLYQGYPFDQTTLGLPSSLNANSNQFPIITVGNGGSSLGPVQGGFGAGIANVGSVNADVTKSLPKNDLSFGFMDAILQNNGNGPANTRFTFQPDYTDQFNGIANSVSNTGYGFASLLIGTPDSGNSNNITAQNAFHAAPQEHYVGFYGQDNWKATRTLTINLGLRYEFQTPWTERDNRQAYFNYTALNPIGAAAGLTLPGEEVYSSSGNRGLTNTNWSNVAPRVGFADQLTPKIVVRGGYGVFFPPEAFVGIQSSPGYQQNTQYNASNNSGLTLLTTLSNPFPNGLLSPTGNALGPLTDVGNTASTGVNHNRHSPLLQQFSLGMQYGLTSNDVVTANYVGNRGVHMLTNNISRTQLNPALVSPATGPSLAAMVSNPFYGVIKSSSCGLDQPTIQQGHLLEPYPQFCGVNESQAPQGDSYYNALLVDYNHRFSQGLNMLVSYTYSKFIDDTGGTADWAYRGDSSYGYRDSYNIGIDRSVDGTDQTHSLVVNYIYELPVGRGKKFASGINRATDAVIGGWQLSGIVTVKTGLPLSVTGGGNTDLFGGSQRPDEVGNPNQITNRVIGNKGVWFNTAAFVAPHQYSLGNTQRYISTFRSPGYDEWDATVQKIWTLTERLRLQGRAEFYNLPNHSNFFTPDTGITDGNYGQISQAFDARSIQFAMKLIW